MRPLLPALVTALLISQVDSADDPLEKLRRNGGSLSFVLEFEIPDYTDEEGNDPLEPPFFVDAVVDADFNDPTEQTRKSLGHDESYTFPKNKIFWDPEERILGSYVKTGNGHSGNVQTSEGSPLETRIKQLQATADTGASSLLETGPADDVRKRIESTDVQTGSRRRDNVRGSDKVIAQAENGRRAKQKEISCPGDRKSNDHLDDVAREQFRSDAATEMRQNAVTPGSEGALAQNEAKATQKQVLSDTDRISASLESNLSAAAQNVAEGPDVHTENRPSDAARGNEEALRPLVTENVSGTSQMESAGGLHRDLEDSKATESSGGSPQREATDSGKGNATTQGSDRSVKAEIGRHIFLEERKMALDESQVTSAGGEASATEVLSERAKDLQEEREVTNGSKSNGAEQETVLENRQMTLDQRRMTGGGVEATTTKQVNEVVLERAKDLQERREVTSGSKSNGTEQEKALENRSMVLDPRQTTAGGVEATTTKQVNEVVLERAKDLREDSEVTNGSKSNGPERGKENSVRSEETVRRTNQESSDVTKDALETTQRAANATVTGQEEVQRQAVVTTEASQMERTGASRSAKDLSAATEINGVNFTEDSTSGRELNTSSHASLGADETEAGYGVENTAKLTLTMVNEKRELLRSDAIPEGGGDHSPKTIAKRSHPTFREEGVHDESSDWEKDLYTDVT